MMDAEMAFVEHKENIEIEARTTIVPSLLFKKEDLLKIAEMVNKLGARWVIQRFNNDQEMTDKKMQGINSPSFSFLEDLKEACLTKFPQLRIEIR